MFSVVVSIFPSQALLLFSHLLSDGERGRDPLFGIPYLLLCAGLL